MEKSSKRVEIIGVYKIQFLLQDKCYVGSSIDVQRRILAHKGKLRKNKHHCSYLQNLWNKYGESNFSFDIIEVCDKAVLLDREQYWMDNSTIVNSMKKAFVNWGYVLSEKACDKRRTALSKENCDKIIQMRLSGMKLKEICSIFNIHRSSINLATTGKSKYGKKIKSFKNKLTEYQVKQIKKLLILGYFIRDIAKKFNVGETIVHNIKTGKKWKNIKHDPDIEVDVTGLRLDNRLPYAQKLEILQVIKTTSLQNKEIGIMFGVRANIVNQIRYQLNKRP